MEAALYFLAHRTCARWHHFVSLSVCLHLPSGICAPSRKKIRAFVHCAPLLELYTMVRNSMSKDSHTPSLPLLSLVSIFPVTLCTTTMVYGGLVHHQAAICTTKPQCAPWCTRETIIFEKFRVYGGLVHHQAQYAPPKRNVHHGAQGRLYFLKNSGFPDNFSFWWFTENTHKICVSGKCMCGSDWHIIHTLSSRCCPLHIVHRAQYDLIGWQF